MANIQKENGYTAIGNDIMDALCKCHPGGSEGQVLLAVIRQTLGWNKNEDRLSISRLCTMTNLARRTIIYAVKNLEAKNMITIKRVSLDGFNEINVIGFQKDHGLWVVQEIDGSARKGQSYKATVQKQKESYKSRVVQEMGSSARNGQRVVQETVFETPFLAPTKDTLTKDTLTKDRDAFSDAIIEKENHTLFPSLFPAPSLFPQWVPENTFLEFVQLRKKLRKPLPEESYPRFFIKLKKLCDDDATGETTAEKLLDQSIVNGWQGIFELKKSNNGNNGSKAKGVVKV